MLEYKHLKYKLPLQSKNTYGFITNAAKNSERVQVQWTRLRTTPVTAGVQPSYEQKNYLGCLKRRKNEINYLVGDFTGVAPARPMTYDTPKWN